MKAPDKIKIGKYNITSDGDVVFGWVTNEHDCEAMQYDIEYIRTDVFIEKAARYLNYRLYDRVEVVNLGTVLESIMLKEEFIEDFKKYMKGE